MQKLFSISTLLVCLILFGMFGCGSDEEKPVEPTTKPTTTEPTLPPEGFIASWEVISINDEDPLAFVNADEPDEEDRSKINTETYYFEFAEDNKWTLNLKFEMVEFPEDPNRDDPEKAGKIELEGDWTGTYSFDDDVLSLVKAETDVSIKSIPEDFFETFFDVNVVVAKNEILEKFNTHVFKPFAKTRITIEGETLTFEATGSDENIMVLKKQ